MFVNVMIVYVTFNVTTALETKREGGWVEHDQSYIQVVMKEDLANVGKSGDLVKVRPGFARNYLLPRDLAVVATSEWAIPLPAVIRLSWPGWMGAKVPTLSRWSISPAKSQLTVCSPVCGCGGTSMPAPWATGSGP
mgnify:CR=1 FL=1